MSKSLIGKLLRMKNCVRGTSHYYIDEDKFGGNPIFLHELSYEYNLYPDVGIRLLCLYRYWNMIQYYFPYRHLITQDWNKKLTEFIPIFCNAKDTLEYQLACLKLIGSIEDTHANLWAGGEAIEKMKGRYTLPFKVKFIDNKLVVSEYYSDSFSVMKTIKIGTTIVKINSEKVCDLMNHYISLAPASNLPARIRELIKPSGFLLRRKDSSTHLQVIYNNKGSSITIKNILYDKYNNSDYPGKVEFYRVINGNIGYIYPQNLIISDIDTIKKIFKKTKGIIIDMRCYPHVFMPFIYGSWLKPKKTSFAKCYTVNLNMPGLFELSDTTENGDIGGEHYNGKIVIIVNEETISQAEWTTMALSGFSGALVIGSTTAGSVGDIADVILPGGLYSRITGVGVLYPDGTQTQRFGVRIDRTIKPTILGITQRKDELLEYAIKLINTEK